MIEWRRSSSWTGSVYSIEVVQRAAYSLIDQLVVLITTAGSAVACEIEPVSGRDAELETSLKEFKRELLNQSLRAKIRSETDLVSNLVLA